LKKETGRTGRSRLAGRWGNVEDIVTDSLCMGCGVCEPVCPVQCISIGESRVNKQQIPFVDQTTCVSGCDVCLRVCPGEEVDFHGLNETYIGQVPDRDDIGHVERSVVGYAADEKLRFEASSGGAATAFLIYLLESDLIDGAIVLRMSRTRPSESEVVVAKTPEEIRDAKGSKYCPGPSATGLREVMRVPGRYAFVGLSCHVHASRKFQEVLMKYRDRIVVTLGLFCGGGITGQGTEFMLHQINVKPDDLSKLTIRGNGFPGKTTAIRKDGSEAVLYKRAAARSAKEAATYQSWMHRYFFPPRCLTCTDVTAQLADVSFGDPWLKRFLSGDCGGGLSMMVCRSAVGLRLLEMAICDGAIVVESEITAQEVADSQAKIPVKTNTRPYRVAARILGIKTPNYKELFAGGSASPTAVLSAMWQYFRLTLGKRRFLWSSLLLLERMTRRSRRFGRQKRRLVRQERNPQS
jgi:coenzyme F420 hydrogenase subunit beta